MKAINTALAILILVLTGCASHGAPAAEVQAASTHVESASEVGETNEMEDSNRLVRSGKALCAMISRSKRTMEISFSTPEIRS